MHFTENTRLWEFEKSLLNDILLNQVHSSLYLFEKRQLKFGIHLIEEYPNVIDQFIRNEISVIGFYRNVGAYFGEGSDGTKIFMKNKLYLLNSAYPFWYCAGYPDALIWFAEQEKLKSSIYLKIMAYLKTNNSFHPEIDFPFDDFGINVIANEYLDATNKRFEVNCWDFDLTEKQTRPLNKEYYISIKGKTKEGPFNFDELKQMLFDQRDLVWSSDLPDWVPITEMEELSQSVRRTPPSLPKTRKSEANYNILQIFKNKMNNVYLIFAIILLILQIIEIILIINANGWIPEPFNFILLFAHGSSAYFVVKTARSLNINPFFLRIIGFFFPTLAFFYLSSLNKKDVFLS